MSDTLIWLDEPLHKNRINYNIEGDEDLKLSFDGTIIAYSGKLKKDNREIFKNIEKFKLGYAAFALPKVIENKDDLIKILFYLSE